METLASGDVLERGEMVDFDDGQLKPYEEVWRDPELHANERIAIVLETDGGCVVRVGPWCQGILKVDNDTASERWHDRVLVQGGGQELVANSIWELEKELAVGEMLQSGGRTWKVVERSVW